MSSENIDAFAQEYLDRANKRREMLAKKLSDTPARRKRIVPLSENQELNLASTKTGDDDSPNKRQCTREEEISKPDTPAIPSVKSRLQNLVSERKNWDDCPVSDAPVPAPRTTVRTSPARDKSPAPAACKTRLANLAQYINNWEDDLKHVVIKKDDKPKKTWEPPKPSTASATEEPKQRGCDPVRKLHDSAPPKPERTLDHVTDDERDRSRSPLKLVHHERSSREEESKVTSTLTVTLGGQSDNNNKSASPVRPMKGANHSSPGQQIGSESGSSAFRSLPARNASPVKPGIANRLAALQQDASKRRESFEPSAQPVAARLASWQERVRKVEQEKLNSQKVNSHPQYKLVTQSKCTQSMAANWEEKIQKEAEDNATTKTPLCGTATPVKSPGKSLPRGSPIKSPTKVAPAAKTIQEKLEKLQENWKQNEIAEKLKQQRQAELAQLENRWKNGLLNEELYTAAKGDAPVSDNSNTTVGSSVPPPPPLPANIPALSQKEASVSMPSPAKSASKTPRPINEEARNKIREEAKSDAGKVAVLDLKEQREKDRHNQAAAKSNRSPRKTPVKVTEEKVTSCQFGKEKVTTTVKVVEGEPPVDVQTTLASTPSRSLYSVIRKHTNSRSDSAHQTPTRSTPVRKQFHDSFSSEETSSEDEAAPHTTVTITTSVERRPSTGSDYSTSQTGMMTQSDDDYSGTEYSIDETEATTQSDYDGNGSSVDESEANGDISGLLEEAMDDTASDPSPQYVARKLPPEAHPGHPEHRPDPVAAERPTNPPQVQLRHPPPKYPRLHQQQKEQRHVAFTSPGGSTYRSESSASDTSLKREIVHSIDNYRSSANIKINAPEPRLKIIRRSEHFDPDDSDVTTTVTSAPEQSVQQQLQKRTAQPQLQSMLQELQELVNVEQNIIKQASNALNQYLVCSQTDAGPECAVECHRLLLQACKKREAYLAEMERLRSGRCRVSNGPKGSLTISNIQLPLKRDFIARMNSPQERNTVHYFIVLFRQGAHVIFTQMVSTEDELVNNAIQIPNMLPMIEIRQDFRIDMEIYSMSVTRDMEPERTPKKKKGLTPKKFASASKRHNPLFQSPGGPTAVSTSNFAFIAGLPITLSIVNKTCFELKRVPFSSPLHGTVNMKLTCLLEALVEEKGFLTMFEDVSGLGNWHRRWCVLKHNVLAYWKYPDEPKFKEPIGIIDLKSCITEEVGLIPRDVCARPNTFELVTVRRQQHGDFDTLVSQCYNTMTTTKHWLSADTKEDRFVWCHKLNEALRNLRMWNPDALRPIRQKLDTGV